MSGGADPRFVVPQIPNATLHRELLLARLGAGESCTLTLVSAGPGSGKTGLLASWSSSLPATVAWLSCDSDDADPLVFWQHVAHALAEPGGEIFEALDPREDAMSLLRTLGRPGRPDVLVIDDFHLARIEPAHLLALVGAVPEGARLVISTRSDPPLPLTRLRLQGRVLELRQADLRFTRDEMAMVLEGLGVALDASQLDTIDGLTEGWTAGVQLAGLSLRAHPRPVELLRTLAETDRSLVDLLVNEVIDLQPDDVRDFLFVSAELEPFDALLCDAVRASADSAALIERVRAANLFLVQLDPDRDAYRYHHLFGQFLRARLRATDPERSRTIHLAAAVACDARGDSIGAVRHAMRGGDVEGARRLLLEQSSRVHSLEDRTLGAEVARTWLREFGTAHLDDLPAAVLECALLLTTVSMGEAEPWLVRVEEREPKLDAEERALLHGVWSRHLLGFGDAEGALARVQRAQGEMPTDPANPWLAALPYVTTQAQVLLSDLDGLEETLEAMQRTPGPPVITEVRLPGSTALLAFLRGELTEAERWAAIALAGAERLGLDETNMGRAEPQLVTALLLLERRHLSAAERELERAMRMVEDGARPPIELLVLLAQVGLALALGDQDTANDKLVDARRSVPWASPRVRALIDAAEARVALHRGDAVTAQRLTMGLPATAAATILRARVRLAEGEERQALRLIEGLHVGTRRERLEQRLVEARALGDEPDRAMRALEDALEVAMPVGFQQVIVGEGPQMLDLLRSLDAGGSMGQYVARLLDGEGDARTSRPAISQDLLDPLSDRELTVLRQLASPQDSREIARSMYLSVNTVRTHVKAIYRKLGVSSRADAVARGRDLALL